MNDKVRGMLKHCCNKSEQRFVREISKMTIDELRAEEARLAKGTTTFDYRRHNFICMEFYHRGYKKVMVWRRG